MRCHKIMMRGGRVLGIVGGNKHHPRKGACSTWGNEPQQGLMWGWDTKAHVINAISVTWRFLQGVLLWSPHPLHPLDPLDPLDPLVPVRLRDYVTYSKWCSFLWHIDTILFKRARGTRAFSNLRTHTKFSWFVCVCVHTHTNLNLFWRVKKHGHGQQKGRAACCRDKPRQLHWPGGGLREIFRYGRRKRLLTHSQRVYFAEIPW